MDFSALARLDRHRTRRRRRRRYERHRVQVESLSFTARAPSRHRPRTVSVRTHRRPRNARTEHGPMRRKGGRVGGQRRRWPLEVILDVKRVYVRRELFPRVFVDEHGRRIERAVFAEEEGGGDVDGVREGERGLDQRDHGAEGDAGEVFSAERFGGGRWGGGVFDKDGRGAGEGRDETEGFKTLPKTRREFFFGGGEL